MDSLCKSDLPVFLVTAIVEQPYRISHMCATGSLRKRVGHHLVYQTVCSGSDRGLPEDGMMGCVLCGNRCTVACRDAAVEMDLFMY